MISRDTSEKCMPSWPMEMPSETEIVPNCIGKPPAACTPSLADRARRSSDRLQGVISFQLEATPIWGLGKSSSDIPTARSIPRAAARSRPSVTSELRGFMFVMTCSLLTRPSGQHHASRGSEAADRLSCACRAPLNSGQKGAADCCVGHHPRQRLQRPLGRVLRHRVEGGAPHAAHPHSELRRRLGRARPSTPSRLRKAMACAFVIRSPGWAPLYWKTMSGHRVHVRVLDRIDLEGRALGVRRRDLQDRHAVADLRRVRRVRHRRSRPAARTRSCSPRSPRP